MTYEIYRMMFWGAAGASGVFLMVSVFLFFWYDIPKVIGDITGSTARKAIQEIVRQNEELGDKAYKPSYVNMKRGKITDKISPSGNIEQAGSQPLGTYVGTQKIDEDLYLDQTTYLGTPQETTLLRETQDAPEAVPPFVPAYATADAGQNQTTVLSEAAVTSQDSNLFTGFEVEQDITFLQSEERLQ